jgi:histidinol dehydrogenase
MKLIKYPSQQDWAELLVRPTFDNSNLMTTVDAVLKEVRTRGDEAVKEYELMFDKVQLSSLQVSEAELKAAEELVSAELKEAIVLAKNNIEKFHSAQQQDLPKIETMPGVTCWQKAVGIDKVGLYIPGGTVPAGPCPVSRL